MTFLQAEWRDLIMANYAVDPALLQPHVPHGVELDYYNDRCYVSLVGFMFRNTRVLGVPVPWHVNFEEVNLRFYVRRRVAGEIRRGVVFFKEIVPRPAITFVARTLYREPYATMPMRHRIETVSGQKNVEYSWKHHNNWNVFRVNADPALLDMPPGSEPEFITEHYYGYTRYDDHRTKEYEVQHPRWQTHPVKDFYISVDFGGLYGDKFAFLQQEKPVSVLLAAGSPITVKTANAGWL